MWSSCWRRLALDERQEILLCQHVSLVLKIRYIWVWPSVRYIVSLYIGWFFVRRMKSTMAKRPWLAIFGQLIIVDVRCVFVGKQKLMGFKIEDLGNVSIEAVLNDTTGTLVACAFKDKECQIGVIVGTGTNACYLETEFSFLLFIPYDFYVSVCWASLICRYAKLSGDQATNGLGSQSGQVRKLEFELFCLEFYVGMELFRWLSIQSGVRLEKTATPWPIS